LAPSSLTNEVVNSMFGAAVDPENPKSSQMTFSTFAALYNILVRFNKFKNDAGVLTRDAFTLLIKDNVCDSKLRNAIEKISAFTED